MLPRNLLLPAAFLTAIGVPMIAFRPDANPFGTSAANSASELTNILGGSSDPMLEGNEMMFIPVSNLGEIIRFDVYPNWVKSRWPRVSTAPGSDGLQGMRVSLVTGSNTWDISGALTYYFDENQRVQRIALTGETGDATQLVKFLVDNYQFKVHQTQAAGLFTATAQRRMYGVLKLENPIVISADEPNRQIRVILELNRPDGKLPISQATINNVQSTRY